MQELNFVGGPLFSPQEHIPWLCFHFIIQWSENAIYSSQILGNFNSWVCASAKFEDWKKILVFDRTSESIIQNLCLRWRSASVESRPYSLVFPSSCLQPSILERARCPAVYYVSAVQSCRLPIFHTVFGLRVGGHKST